MDSAPFSEALYELDGALSSSGGALKALAACFKGREGTVAATIKKASRTPLTPALLSGPNETSVADAVSFLKSLQPFLELAGSAGFKGDVERAIQWLDSNKHLGLTRYLDTVARFLEAAPAEPATTSVREAIVQSYVERFSSAKVGSDAYEAILNDLKGDRQARALEVAHILAAVRDQPVGVGKPKRAEDFARLRIAHDAYRDSAARSGAITPPRAAATATSTKRRLVKTP